MGAGGDKMGGGDLHEQFGSNAAAAAFAAFRGVAAGSCA